ncbi:MAG: GHKL domain-containing protein [Clostridiales bacterium]|nr:GHKL domain-containing protein [Clostridiales bacterium]
MTLIFSTLEMLVAFIYYNIIFNKKMKNNISIYLLMSIITGILFQLEFRNGISNNPFLVSYIICCITISKLDKKDIMLSSVEFAISIIFLSISEAMLYLIIYLPVLSNYNLEDNNVFLLTCSIICFIVVGFLLSKIRSKINSIERIINRNRIVWVLIANIVFFVLIIRIGSNAKIFSDAIYFECFFLLVMVAVVNIYSYRFIFLELEEKKKLEINKEYKVVIDELLDKFRENEHEYKNHLNTLNSIVELEGNDDLKTKVGNYIKGIKNQDNYSDLMYIDSTIIKAVLYNKIQECSIKNISLKYSILSNLEDSSLQNYELSTLLNNLLNNAIEAVEKLDEKNIFINISKDKNKKYRIVVRNNINKDTNIDLNKIFNKGTSSKGKNRGYGLFTVKKIVESHNGEIQLFIKDNYLEFTIII